MATDGGSDGVAVAAARATLPANPYAKQAFNARKGGQQAVNAEGSLGSDARDQEKVRWHGGTVASAATPVVGVATNRTVGGRMVTAPWSVLLPQNNTNNGAPFTGGGSGDGSGDRKRRR